MKRSKRKLTKKITAAIVSAMSAVFTIIPAYAAEVDGWEAVTNWGESLADNLQGLCKVIAVIAVIILSILCISGGRDWVNKLKTVGGGILVGIVLASYGASIAIGLFA